MNIIRKARISADKRSIAAYGRSIELAIANYLLDNGDFPTDISQLTIEYSGDRVECSTARLNSDSSVYLSGCTVGGRNVDYTYGKEENVKYSAYSIGEEVEYKGINFYVIKNSDATSSTVTLLKAEPLTVLEVNEYGEGHLNNYSYCTGGCQVGIASNQNGYGRMAYYTSPSCGEKNYSGCTTNYASSDVKYVVDGWTQVSLTSSDLVVDSTGYSSRLLTIDELENLNYSWGELTPSDIGLVKTEDTPSFVYNSQYSYWTMSAADESLTSVWNIEPTGGLSKSTIHNGNIGGVVRPVITINKSYLN